MKRKQQPQLISKAPERGRLSAVDACYLGAAEAFKFGSDGNHLKITRAQISGAREAMEMFKHFSDDAMALALLVGMVELGRRIERKEHGNEK